MKIIIIECDDVDNRDRCEMFENKKEAVKYINKNIKKNNKYIDCIMCFVNKKRIMNIKKEFKIIQL